MVGVGVNHLLVGGSFHLLRTQNGVFLEIGHRVPLLPQQPFTSTGAGGPVAEQLRNKARITRNKDNRELGLENFYSITE
jgi:hypothetical protein